MDFFINIFTYIVLISLFCLLIFFKIPNYSNGGLCVSCHEFDIDDGHIICEHHPPTKKHQQAKL